MPCRTATTQNQGLSCYAPKEGATILKNVISVSANGDYSAFWHEEDFTILQDSYALDGKNFTLNRERALFCICMMRFYLSKYDWNDKSGWNKIKDTNIKLPTKDNKIDFDFMESFIGTLEYYHLKELDSFLKTANLDTYKLSNKEKSALEEYNFINWKPFTLKNLFGNSSRGKRLKSEDRFPGNLPFVTAGEKNEGVSDFISNDVTIFSKNTITIDMFGSTKYRDYEYGADDHITVVHTESLEKNASIFVAASIEKTSHRGQFTYGRNFYPKHADQLNIMLPVKNDKPDYEYMGTLISAVHKLLIKDIIIYKDKIIELTKNIPI